MKRPALTLLVVATLTGIVAFAGAFALARWVTRQHAPTAASTALTRGNTQARAGTTGLPVVGNPGPVDSAPPSTFAGANWPKDAPTPEQVLYAQPQLLATEIATLKPRTPGKVNLYAIAFAGDGSENVFRNEAEYFNQLFSRRFNAAGHVLVLENNPASLATRPLASWSNLEDALDALATKMDPKQDILLLYFTTHGSEDHTLLVDMGPLPLDQIGANDLPGILAEHPFKYKVVIVNACYSGGFIPPLHGTDNMIITAARSDRSSFGCGEQSQLTWFGHAFLVNALNRTVNLQGAFAMAKQQVATWEKRENFEPSEPQISVGNGIAAQLAAWRGGFTPGPAQTFSPAPTSLPAVATTAGSAP